MTSTKSHMTTNLRLALICGCAVLTLCACSKGHGPDAEDAAKPSALITTAAVETTASAEGATAYGVAEVAPEGERSLVAPVEAVVDSVLVSQGATVRAGQVLMRLKASAQSELDLKKSAADLDVAHRALERALRLRGGGLVSDGDVETARAADLSATETHRSLGARIAAIDAVKAPADGVIEALSVNPGEQVSAGAALGRLGQTAALRVRLNLDLADAARVRPGASVVLKTPGDDDAADRTEGVVSQVSQRIDPQTHLATAWVAVHAGLAPGQPVQGRIALSRDHSPAVPRAALVYEDDKACVFVVEQGVAHKRTVRVGAEDGDKVAVVDGLKPGERVAVEGAAVLEDGMAVREAASK